MKSVLLFSITLLVSFASRAYVLAPTRELFEIFVDGQIETPHATVDLKRIYRSSNLSAGLFGRGWCTAWEEHLRIGSDGVVFFSCGVGGGTVMKKGDGFFYSDHGLRLQKSANSYVLLEPSSGTKKTFDLKGLLLSMRELNGSGFTLDYNLGKVERIHIEGVKEPLRITYGKNGHIQEIRSGPLGATYSYKEHDLVSVHNLWGNNYFFENNQNGAITKIRFPDHTSEVITYDSKQLVTSLTDRFGCVEKISSDHKIISAVKTCHGKVVAQGKFEDANSSGKRDSLGRTIETRVAGALIQFTYSENGARPQSARVRSARGKVSTYNYLYDQNGRPKEISLENGDSLQAQYSEGSALIEVRQLHGFKHLSQWNLYPSTSRGPASVDGTVKKHGQALIPLLMWNQAVSPLEEQ